MAVRTATAGLAVRLFGGTTAFAGGEVADLGGRRPQAILARLAWESGRLITVDQLTDDVWGDHPPRRVRAAIQVHISHLRVSLDAIGHRDAIATQGPSYVLQVPPASVDVLAFAALADSVRRDDRPSRAAADDARRALLLWGGRPFAGLESVPFVDPVVTWLESRRTEVVVAAATRVQSRDEAQQLLPIVERIAVARPLDEALGRRGPG